MNFKNNALITCDALSFLERLPSEVFRLIYLDPPWLTNASLEQKKQDEYVTYLAKVTQQIQRVLVEDGSLFIHWSQISPIDIRLVVNQAFGKEPNYEITWHKKNYNSSNSSRLKIDNEIILVYSKSDSPICNKLYSPLSPEASSFYNKKDEKGLYRTSSLIASSERPLLQFDWRGYHLPSKNSWRFTFDKLENFVQENRIYFPEQGLPQLKQYLDDHLGIEIGMTWDDISSYINLHERTNTDFYSAQKPIALLERIIQIGSNPEDLILDPFCGTGTTLVAAQSLNRRWLGVDNSLDVRLITIERLLISHNLEATKDYDVYTEDDISRLPIIDKSYKDIVVRVVEIAELKLDMETKLVEISKLKDENTRLRQSVGVLTDTIFRFKKLMNIGDDNERVEDAIREIEDCITTYIKRQSVLIENYVNVVCLWLTGGWDRLEKGSQSFLPQAELLFEIIGQTDTKDYSPFIIQYCRAFENELLIKLFSAYTNDLHNRKKNNVDTFLLNDSKGEKTGKFAKLLKNRKNTYTFGDMIFIMGLLKADGNTLKESRLLQDFRDYTVRYFDEQIVNKIYLDQIERIKQDFRNKAAHPYILDIEAAKACREQVRKCLNELILNYKTGEF